MQQSASHIISIRIIPSRTWLALGPGWAVLAGAIASGQIRFEVDLLLRLALLWLLADPLLGTVWYLLTEWGLWRRLTRPDLSPEVKLKWQLPYAAQDSASRRTALFLVNLFALPGGEGFTLFMVIVLAIIMAIFLGWPVIIFTVSSIFLAGLIREKIAPARPAGWRIGQSAALFLLPYLAGLQLVGGTTPTAFLLGGAYWVVYAGGLQLLAGRGSGIWLVLLGQGAAALLLFSLTQPFFATAVALAVLFSAMLFTQPKSKTSPDWYARHLRPFLLVGFLLAAIAVGGLI